MIRTSLIVRHNIEVAHRLFETPGKCENIHGHSMYVNMVLDGPKDHRGFVLGLDFGDVKKLFRSYLDEYYDHRLLLNMKDPWAQMFSMGQIGEGLDQEDSFLPGLRRFDQEPTTENIAARIGLWAQGSFIEADSITVTVEETAVNSAMWTWSP